MRAASPVLLCFAAPIAISIRVSSLILKPLDETIEDDSKNGTQKRSDPVDPVIAVEVSQHDVGTKRSSGVQRCSGEVDTCGS
jgi:hypothetical protein